MNTIILDIETIASPLDAAQMAYLTKNSKDDAETAIELDKAALWPLTGQIVCVGMYNPGTLHGRCFSSAGELQLGSLNPGWVDDSNASEAMILKSAWEAMKAYGRIVTFNGRSFDLPYLLLRSAILGVQPSRLDLMGQRFSTHPHCDLLEQLSFYGATRKMSLDMYCRAFGIETPKDGCDGSQVAVMHAAGEHRKIAEYCMRDCVATAALYEIWLKRLIR